MTDKRIEEIRQRLKPLKPMETRLVLNFDWWRDAAADLLQRLDEANNEIQRIKGHSDMCKWYAGRVTDLERVAEAAQKRFYSDQFNPRTYMELDMALTDAGYPAGGKCPLAEAMGEGD